MSKLINQTRLQQFATKLWDKIKNRYDNAFVNATITTKAETDKKIKFTKASGGTTVDIDLIDYARLSDKNDFAKDVSSNIGMVDGTLKLGQINGSLNQNRVSGYRSITTKSFVDGYVNHLVVLTDENLSPGTSTVWTVWAVEKKENRREDVVYKKYDDITTNVKNVSINGTSYRSVELPINEKFDKEIYFIVGCDQRRGYKVINLNAENQNDNVVNVSTRPGGAGSNISWEEVTNNIAVILLYGRESISSLSEKLKQTQADGSLYVKHSETVNAGGTANANKVVKLDDAGKLNKDMLPAIAINEFITIRSTSFNENSLNGKEYQNGDTIFNATTQKRYLCIDRDNATFLDRFIELNSKDGIVTSVEGKTGEVTLNIALEENKFKLKINGTGGTETVKEIEMISEDEITNMINALS